MAAIEPEARTHIPAPRPRAERAVFVTDDDRRAVRLRRAAVVVGAMACLWLLGLGIGSLGLGSLPSLSVPLVERIGAEQEGAQNPAAPVRRQPASDSDAAVRPAVGTSAAREATHARSSVERTTRARPNGAVRGSARRVVRRTPLLPAPVAPTQPATPPATAPPVAPARGNLTSPPGHTQRETRTQSTTEPPGQARRTEAQQTPPAEPSPAANPTTPTGQQKPDKPPKG